MPEVQRRTDETTLEPADCTRYRSGVMRVAYLSLDRPDLAHAVKCLHGTCSSQRSHFADLKRVGRYLHSHRCLAKVYNRQDWSGKVTVTVDTDFAGDQVTRKSTTGVATFRGSRCVRTQSNLQSTWEHWSEEQCRLEPLELRSSQTPQQHELSHIAEDLDDRNTSTTVAVGARQGASKRGYSGGCEHSSQGVSNAFALQHTRLKRSIRDPSRAQTPKDHLHRPREKGGAHIQHPPDDAPVPESMAQCQRQQTHCIWPLQYAACPVVHCTLVPCSAPRMFQQQQQQQPHVNSMVQQAGDGGRIATCRGLHQRTSSDTCHLKLLMSEHFVGAIMGNAGCDIEEVVANTGCRLQVSALDQHYPGTNDRIVVLSGELPGLKECVRMILWKLYTLYPHNHGRMVATLAVPSSAVSRIVGRKGEAVKQISFSTECHVRVSCRVDGFQERLVLISGEYPNLVEAVSKVCRYIQGDPHLLEHLALSYDIALPFNCWVGKKTRATQIISPADVQRHNKRELVHYLRRTASRKILRRYSLLGNTKNIMKANSVEQLHRAVIETHEELQARIDH
eukprot:6490890-Amphidinium_carterae.4